MRFGVLGPLEVRTADGREVTIPERKVRALLVDLLMRPGRALSADRLVEDLWGERPPSKPDAVLRSKVSQLRRALRDAEPDVPDPLVRRGSGYVLEVEPDAIDAYRFEALLERAGPGRDVREQVRLLAEALALWRGPALADFVGETFAAGPVARLEEARLTALEDRAELRFELGEDVTLVAELADLTSGLPLRERLRTLQMRVLYRLGRQGEALTAYADLRDRLCEELGVEPGPAAVALHHAILRQDEALGATPYTPPGPAAAERRPGNLPRPLTSLVGRDEAVGRVRGALADGRLVTLIGMGGVGKTRLAVEAAAGLADRFRDGVWMVELAALDRSAGPDAAGAPGAADPASLEVMVERVAAGLSVRLGGGPSPGRDGCVERLAAALSGRTRLVVLDNCEHVVDDAAELAGRLLRAVPGLRVLATSHVPLGVAGEQVWPVAPLDLPGPDAGHDPERLLESAAVRMFTVRARAGAPGFELGPDNAADVAAVCRRLDGLPLALELAATRVRAMGVRQLSAGLDDRFGLLVSGRRAEPVRQRTLRAVIDWSWDLLSEPERTLLRRLAVHADGCTLAAAREVCAGGDVTDARIPDLLARLVDRSLVVMTDHTGEPRYRLLESVSAYCRQRLAEAGELPDLQLEHARYLAGFAERADRRLRGADQRVWLSRLDAETADLRAAAQACAQRGEASLALRLACALAWYWVLRGRVAEGRRTLAAALAVEGPAPAALRATAMTWQAGIAALAGEPPDPLVADRHAAVRPCLDALGAPDEGGQGREAMARAVLLLAIVSPIDVGRPADDPVVRLHEVFRELGDPWGEAASLSVLAYHAQLLGDFPALRRYARRSLALFRDVGDQWGLLQASTPLADAARLAGDYEQAARWYADGLRIARELGLRAEEARQLAGVGRIAQLHGEHARARQLYLRARELAGDESVKVMEQVADLGLAESARRQGRHDEADRLLLPWLDWNRRAGWPAGMASVLAELGYVAEQRGDARTALARHREGYEAACRTAESRTIALAVEGLAGALALAGDAAGAARLLGAAGAARESAGMALPPAERGDVERAEARIREVLGAEDFRAEFRYGARLQPEECVKALPDAGEDRPGR